MVLHSRCVTYLTPPPFPHYLSVSDDASLSLSEKHFGLISQLAACPTNKDEDKTSQMTPMIILYYCSELVQNIFNMEALQIKVASRNF